MRILVTGGAGFIGSHVVDALVAGGHDVLVVDALHPAAHRERPADLNPGAEYVFGDISDIETARTAVNDVGAVCHQAAMVGLGVDFADAPGYARANDLGTATLLAALHDRGFAGRIVLASSMVVYGEGAYRCGEHGSMRPPARRPERLAAADFEARCPDCDATVDPEPVTETMATDPRNVYAATKLHQEHLCRAYGREHGAPVAALRYHNVYGPRMPRDTPYAGVAALFRSALERGEAPRVFEDGAQRRDFVHVDDVARANVLALSCADPVDEALNVATGRPRTVLQMAEALCDAVGPSAPAPRVVGGFRAGDVRHVFASSERARERLGFEAEVSFEDGMREFATAPLRAVG